MATINYVKFLRGTPASYQKLTTYDNNTLYFISEKNAKTGVLYLGDKILSDSTSLSSLINIGIENAEVKDGDFLVYDSEKGSWVSKSANELNVSGSANVYTTELTSDETHATAINRAIGNNSIAKGDIVILTKDIDGTHTEYTAYVYNGKKWQAMDGNYSAENVYFGTDLTTTSSIGNIQLSNGSATINAIGKNLKEVWDSIFINEKNPSITGPSITLTAKLNKSYEVGTKVSPTYSISFDGGKYEFGPSTNVTATSYSATLGEETLTSKSGTFSEITVTDATNMSITAFAKYSAGSVPVTNLGNSYTSGLILAGLTATITSLNAITGYRNTFYGTFNSKEDEYDIRSLDKSNKALFSGNDFTITIPEGAVRVVFAYPETLGEVKSVLDVNGMNAEIKSAFTLTTKPVNGYDGYDAIMYNVYQLDYANPIDIANTYKVTI